MWTNWSFHNDLEEMNYYNESKVWITLTQQIKLCIKAIRQHTFPEVFFVCVQQKRETLQFAHLSLQTRYYGKRFWIKKSHVCHLSILASYKAWSFQVQNGCCRLHAIRKQVRTRSPSRQVVHSSVYSYWLAVNWIVNTKYTFHSKYGNSSYGEDPAFTNCPVSSRLFCHEDSEGFNDESPADS